MGTTHGNAWVAWQEVWQDGLRELKDRHVIVVASDDKTGPVGSGVNFQSKFERHTTDEENKGNHFDATWELPAGDRAKCILDWERRHVAMCAAQNSLKIWFCSGKSGWRCGKPDWYGLPFGFQEKGTEWGGLMPKEHDQGGD